MVKKKFFLADPPFYLLDILLLYISSPLPPPQTHTHNFPPFLPPLPTPFSKWKLTPESGTAYSLHASFSEATVSNNNNNKRLIQSYLFLGI